MRNQKSPDAQNIKMRKKKQVISVGGDPHICGLRPCLIVCQKNNSITTELNITSNMIPPAANGIQRKRDAVSSRDIEKMTDDGNVYPHTCTCFCLMGGFISKNP